MSIVSEIDRIKTNIAGSYLSASTKGAIIPENQNSDNLPSTIDTIPEAETSIVIATNYTGNTINKGSKVWLNETARITSDNYSLNSYDYKYNIIIDPSGLYTYAMGSFSSAGIWDNNTKTQVLFVNTKPVLYGSHKKYPHYEKNNKIYWYKYLLYNGSITTLDNRIYINEDYDYSYTGSKLTFYKVDRNTDTVLHTWTNSESISDTTFYWRHPITAVNNRIFWMYYYSQTNAVRYTDLDENQDTFNISSTNWSDMIVYITSDKKYAFCGNFRGNQSSGEVNTVWKPRVYDSQNNTYFDTKVFNNQDLNTLLNTAGTLIYNKQSDTLCYLTSGTLAGNTYTGGVFGFFKYNKETEDFDTVTISDVNSTGYSLGISISDDLDTVTIRDKVFLMYHENDFTYKAIPYSYGLGINTITGVANSNATVGQQFEATTALEIGSTSENLLYNESNELNVILRSEENQPQESNIETLVESIERLEEILGE